MGCKVLGLTFPIVPLHPNGNLAKKEKGNLGVKCMGKEGKKESRRREMGKRDRGRNREDGEGKRN